MKPADYIAEEMRSSSLHAIPGQRSERLMGCENKIVHRDELACGPSYKDGFDPHIACQPYLFSDAK